MRNAADSRSNSSRMRNASATRPAHGNNSMRNAADSRSNSSRMPSASATRPAHGNNSMRNAVSNNKSKPRPGNNNFAASHTSQPCPSVNKPTDSLSSRSSSFAPRAANRCARSASKRRRRRKIRKTRSGAESALRPLTSPPPASRRAPTGCPPDSGAPLSGANTSHGCGRVNCKTPCHDPNAAPRQCRSHCPCA